jgi:diaminohydroxyphosphoribosylaminopyrimidine deaminase/5-amino-6-(5-phosphoribosylamino)uracil reductase
MTDQDARYMQAALKLARRGIGSVEPNPAVGCIIVKRNQIIGKGWHKKFGAAHAEINALEDCKNLGVNPRGATMYVTLEPCSHHAKTPPCTDAVIAAGVAEVVVAMIDPSPHAGGKGIEKLRTAGIKVKTRICETQARLLNAPFIKFAATGKTWVILKWAQSIDGKVAWADRTQGQRWISNELSRKDVHKLRRRAQAILVGINTVLADDPLLTARPREAKKATRIVLDSHLRIPLDCEMLATARQTPVLIVAWQGAVQANPQAAEIIAEKGAEIITYPDTQGRSNLYFLLDELSKRSFAQLLVEGGPRVITSFLKENLADELCVYIAPKILGARGSADISGPMTQLTGAVGLNYVDVKRFGDDVRLTGLTKKAINETSILEG